MKKIVISILIIALSSAVFAQETQQNKNWTSARPDGHAPISIMGDHIHKKGEFMISYRYMPMWMSGNIQNSDEISDQRIQQAGFKVAPQNMTMDMHMLGAMYAPTDKITLMVMANYITKQMDLKVLGNGNNFSTKSSGLGDVMLSSLIKIINKNQHAVHANLGLSIPTGALDESDDLPVKKDARLAYPMQQGSGTFDPQLGATYLGQTNLFSWGAQVLYKIRLGKNSEDYTFGNRVNASAWGAIMATDFVSFSTSLRYYKQGDINGSDSELDGFKNNSLMPLFNTQNSGRSQLDMGIGANFLLTGSALKGLRIATEIAFPVMQEANGIQMEKDLVATFGIQYAFGHSSRQ